MKRHAAFAARRLAHAALPIFVLWLGASATPAKGIGKPAAYTPSGEWEGYFRNDRGATAPVLQPIEQNRDKDWMFLQFTDYSGPKIRLAVMKVENKTAVAEQASQTDAVAVTPKVAEVPVAALDEILTTAVINTHRFEVLERKAMPDLLSEQDLGASGRVHPKKAAQTGKLQGVQYMLYAAINQWTPEKGKADGRGLGKGWLGMVGVQRSNAEVAMSFRIVDSTSGQVLFAATERATADSWGLGLNGLGQGAGALIGYKKTSPIDYAVQSCVNKGVYKVAMWLKDRPWSGLVARVASDKVYINAGSNEGLSAGMVLNALSRGAEIVDPSTGKSLGSDSEAIGMLKVVEVRENYAVASVLQGCHGLKVGDQVELRGNSQAAHPNP